MRISHYRRSGTLRFVATGAGWTLLVLGCASPGPPLPPSLKLPEIATNVTAARVGGAVTITWITPARTTDKLFITGKIEAVVCRELPFAGQKAANGGCAPVIRLPVTPGASKAEVSLPAALLAEPPRLLAYRVELRNESGHSAGPSAPAYVASGPSPAAIENMHAMATKRGVVLEWKAEGKPDSASDEAIELVRTALDAPAPLAAVNGRKSVLPLGDKEPKEAHFLAGGSSGLLDAGGTIDGTAMLGRSYRYTAQRVRTAVVDGKTLEVRSVASAELTVKVPADYPPDTPAALVTIAGFQGGAQKPVIDLSWEPVMEARLAGYRVYRREGYAGEWTRLDAEVVRVAAYRDLTVVAGRSYTYRVTAVNEAGSESGPSAQVVETAPAP